jgi:hypothetical protein
LLLSECKFNTNFNFHKFLIPFYQKTFYCQVNHWKYSKNQYPPLVFICFLEIYEIARVVT